MRIRPKQLNSKPLNGEMLFNLAKSYADSINAGAVPSIESSWSYICKNECQKATLEALREFEQQFYDEYASRCPFTEEELKMVFKDVKKRALSLFDKSAVGDVKDQFYVQLKK